MSSTQPKEKTIVKRRRHKKTSTDVKVKPTSSVSQTNEIPVIDISQSNSDIQINTNEINGFSDVSNLTRKKSGFFVGNVDERFHFVLNKNIENNKTEADSKSQRLHTFEGYMKRKEENFKASYVKIVNKNEENEEFDLRKITENVFTNMRMDIKERESEHFTAESCDFSGITIETHLFQPKMDGISKDFLKNSEELVNELNGKKVRVDFDKMKAALNMSELAISESQPKEEVDFCKEINELFKNCRQEISENEFMINLSHPDAEKLISLIAQFFYTGMKIKPREMLDDILSYMTTTSSDASLQSTINRAKRIDDKKESFDFFIDFVLNLLEESQCSSLLNYLNDNIQLKLKYYYASSPILDSTLSHRFSIDIERIDVSELNGFFRSKSMTMPPYSDEKVAEFFTVSIDEYLKKVQKWIIQGVDYKSNQLEPLSQILFLFMNTLLTNSDGNVSPLSSLWDLYGAIAKSNSRHPMFSKFCKILKSEEVDHGFNPIPKAIRATVLILNEDILPYVLLFSNNTVKTSSVPAPYYLNNMESCIKISYALLPLANQLFHVKYDLIKPYLI